jgi:hypothetical protein
MELENAGDFVYNSYINPDSYKYEKVMIVGNNIIRNDISIFDIIMVFSLEKELNLEKYSVYNFNKKLLSKECVVFNKNIVSDDGVVYIKLIKHEYPKK